MMEEMVERNEKNLFFRQYLNRGIRENLFSDVAGALGHMQSQVVRSAAPLLLGRSIIETRQTKEPFEKFALDSKAVAYSYVEGAATRFSGRKNDFVVVDTNIFAESSEQWTREFLEDATWNVMQSIDEKIGKALAEDETKTVLDLYESVDAEDLAGGGFVDQGSEVIDWNAIQKLHSAVRGENWRPTVLVLNETQLSQLLLDDKFIDYDSLPSSEVDIEQGTIRKIVGMRVHSSTLVPNGTAYAIDTRVAGIMLIRRDVAVEDWSEPKVGQYGVRATTRFGLGILRSKAIAKMVNIKTTL